MNVYKALTVGIDEVIVSNKYRGKHSRRIDLCVRYNSAIALVLESENLTDIGRAKVRGVKGLITKSIVDGLNDSDLNTYVSYVVHPILADLFGKCEI